MCAQVVYERCRCGKILLQPMKSSMKRPLVAVFACCAGVVTAASAALRRGEVALRRHLRGHCVQRRVGRGNPREGADVRAHLPPRVQGPSRTRLSDRPRLRRAKGPVRRLSGRFRSFSTRWSRAKGMRSRRLILATSLSLAACAQMPVFAAGRE